jgi:hypothetical protein
MTAGNKLLLDKNNTLAMYKPPDKRLGEALSRSVYQYMYCPKQLLCPLICYTDGTQIGSMSRFDVESFLFTPAVLSYATHCKAEAWQPF